MNLILRLTVAAVMVFGGSAMAQGPGSAPGADHYWQIYKAAQKYGDAAVAINALYHLHVLNPDDVGIKDSLASVYFMSGNWAQSIVLAREVVARKPDDPKMLELMAISYSSLGMLKESVEGYERLYKVTQNPYHLYQLAVRQYELKRYEECAQSLNTILAHPQAATEKIPIEVDRQNRQKISLKGAALNVLGVVHRDLNKTEAAKQYFEQSLAADPDFLLPKNNLADMEKKK